jgi:hypothetical protein
MFLIFLQLSTLIQLSLLFNYPSSSHFPYNWSGVLFVSLLPLLTTLLLARLHPFSNFQMDLNNGG